MGGGMIVRRGGRGRRAENAGEGRRGTTARGGGGRARSRTRRAPGAVSIIRRRTRRARRRRRRVRGRRRSTAGGSPRRCARSGSSRAPLPRTPRRRPRAVAAASQGVRDHSADVERGGGRAERPRGVRLGVAQGLAQGVVHDAAGADLRAQRRDARRARAGRGRGRGRGAADVPERPARHSTNFLARRASSRGAILEGGSSRAARRGKAPSAGESSGLDVASAVGTHRNARAVRVWYLR